jgi:hypothetical protein
MTENVLLTLHKEIYFFKDFLYVAKKIFGYTITYSLVVLNIFSNSL